MITLKTGFAAVPRQLDGIVAVQGRTVLFYVFAVYLSRHLTTATLLLPEKNKNKHTHISQLTWSYSLLQGKKVKHNMWSEITLSQNLQVHSGTGHSA